MLGAAARSPFCNGKPVSNFLFHAQRTQIHSPMLSSNLALNSPKRLPRTLLKSYFSTTARRPQGQQQKAIASAATAPTAAVAARPVFWERLGPLTKFFRWYGRANTHRPYLTQFLSSLVIFCTGDLAAQYVGGEEYDYKRTLRILAISAGSSIIIFKWSVNT